jgi:hypothetical protein
LSNRLSPPEAGDPLAGSALSTDRHGPISRHALAWLLFLADPEPRRRPPADPLRQHDLAPLLAAARLHGVLPAVLRGLRQGEPALGASERVGAAEALVRHAIGTSVVLRHHARRVLGALDEAGIAAAIVKGPAFADHLYPDAGLRPFGDADILVRPADRAAVAPVMARLGFRAPAVPDCHGDDHHEDQWFPEAQPGILIEIQDDLVHAPAIARRKRFGLDDLLAAGAGDPAAPGALLLTAAVHGAIGHQCDRLRFLVDIGQAARRMPPDTDWARLRALAVECGILDGVTAALDLAARTFADPASAAAARRLGGRPALRLLTRLLWSPATVLRAQGQTRRRGSWRRKAVRELLKRTP